MTTQQFHTTIQDDIGSVLGYEHLDAKDQVGFIAQIGETILDSALLRLVAGLNDEQSSALAHYLEDEPTAELLMKHLFDHYPQFEELLTE